MSEEIQVPPLIVKLARELVDDISRLREKLERLHEVAASYLDSAALIAADNDDERSMERLRIYAALYGQVRSIEEYLEDALAFLESIPEADTAAYDLTVEDVIEILEDRLGEIRGKKQRTTIDEWHATAYEYVIEKLRKRGDWR